MLHHSVADMFVEICKVHERLNAHIARIGIAKFKAELAKFQQIQKAIQVGEISQCKRCQWCAAKY